MLVYGRPALIPKSQKQTFSLKMFQVCSNYLCVALCSQPLGSFWQQVYGTEGHVCGKQKILTVEAAEQGVNG